MSRMSLRFRLAAGSACWVALLGWAITAIPAPTSPEDFGFFEEKVRPVLAEHCYQCHSAEASKVKGGLRLDSREGIRRGGDSGRPAVVPGEPEKSLLVQAIRYTNEDLRM